jgi:regulator of cell morphogenesis and NO signaling
MHMDRTRSVGTIVAEKPGAASIFERYGIDYCCRGDRHLDEVCAEAGIEAEGLIREIECAPREENTPDWAAMDRAELCDEIERRWHRPLHAELPLLDALARKVASVHGARHPELHTVEATLTSLCGELERHMWKEEHVLFPLIRARGAAPEPPLRVMRHEHHEAGAALAQLRALTNDYVAPADGCASYRELMVRLAGLERDLHAHIHVENNILFAPTLDDPWS